MSARSLPLNYISQAYLCKPSLVGLLLCWRHQEARQLYQQKQEKWLLQSKVSTGQATVCWSWYFTFQSVLTNRNHLLYPLLPAVKTQHYDLRTRPHNLTLTRKSCHYDNCNFISRMIFYDVYWLSPLYYFYLLVAVRFDIAFNKHILCVCCIMVRCYLVLMCL